MPSVLCRCWLGILPVKNWVMGYWRGYRSGVWCKWFPYGPADATVTPSSLGLLKSRMVCLSDAGLPRLSLKKVCWTYVVCSRYDSFNATFECTVIGRWPLAGIFLLFVFVTLLGNCVICQRTSILCVLCMLVLGLHSYLMVILVALWCGYRPCMVNLHFRKIILSQLIL